MPTCFICYDDGAECAIVCDVCAKEACHVCYARFLETGLARCVHCGVVWDRARVARDDMVWFLPDFNARVGDEQVAHERAKLGETVLTARLVSLQAIVARAMNRGSASVDICRVVNDLLRVYTALMHEMDACDYEDRVFLRWFGHIFDGSDARLHAGLCIDRRTGPSGVDAMRRAIGALSQEVQPMVELVFMRPSPTKGIEDVLFRIRAAATRRRTDSTLSATPAAAAGKPVTKCLNDACDGIIGGGGDKCNRCEKFMCDACRTMCDDVATHTCDAGCAASVAAVRASGQKCPRCGMQIVRTEGCDDMWCTICHVHFSYRTGIESMVARHNPHAIAWQKANSERKQRVGDCAIDPEILRILNRLRNRNGGALNTLLELQRDPMDQLVNAGKYKAYLYSAHRHTAHRRYDAICVNGGRGWPGLYELRVKRLLGELSDASFDQGVRRAVFQIEYDHMFAGVLDALHTTAREILLDVYDDYAATPVALRRDTLFESMTLPRFEQLVAFFSDVLLQSSRLFRTNVLTLVIVGNYDVCLRRV